MTHSAGRHLRVVQSNVSDARFRKDLSGKTRTGDENRVPGQAFFVQDDEFRLNPRTLEEASTTVIEYFTDRKSLL